LNEIVHGTVTVVAVITDAFKFIPVLRGLGSRRDTVNGETKFVPVSVTLVV
jgi:hypothetical protein